MILAVARTHLARLRRDRAGFTLAFIVPIVFFSVFALIFGGPRGATRSIPVAVVDEDRTEISRRFVAALRVEKGLRVETGRIPEGTRTERPYSFRKRNGVYEVRLQAPFAAKGEVGLFKKGQELVIEVGAVRRHIGLPSSMSGLSPARARLDGGMLVVELQETI